MKLPIPSFLSMEPSVFSSGEDLEVRRVVVEFVPVAVVDGLGFVEASPEFSLDDVVVTVAPERAVRFPSTFRGEGRVADEDVLVTVRVDRGAPDWEHPILAVELLQRLRRSCFTRVGPRTTGSVPVPPLPRFGVSVGFLPDFDRASECWTVPLIFSVGAKAYPAACYPLTYSRRRNLKFVSAGLTRYRFHDRILTGVTTARLAK